MTGFTLAKKDAARRQLEVALELYFSHGDVVAAWTLGAAAYNILRDLRSRYRAEPMMLKDQLPSQLAPPLRQLVMRKIQEVENFLKHADSDPTGTLDFEPKGRIELLLFDASLKYLELFGNETPYMSLIRMWFLSNAMIEHDGGEDFDAWLERIKPLSDEPPADYRSRMWSEAERTARAWLQHKAPNSDMTTTKSL